MEGKTQVNFWLEDDKKDEWEKHLEETNEFPTLSQLIRTSVREHITGQDEEKESQSPAIATDVQALKDELKEVRSDVSWIRKQFLDDDVLSDLAQEVFDTLEPLHPQTKADHVPENVDMDLADYQQYLGAQAVIEPSGDDGERSPQTARALADRFGVGPSEVEDAIDHLQDQFLPVVEIEYWNENKEKNEIHYFKEA